MPTWMDTLREIRDTMRKNANSLGYCANFIDKLIAEHNDLKEQIKAKDEAIRAALDVALRVGLRAKLEQALKGD